MTSNNTDAPIKTPVTIRKTKEYTGDIPTMGGGTEVGFWLDRYVIADANGAAVASGIQGKATADHIAKILNDHAQLLSENAEISARLSLAVEALEHYADKDTWNQSSALDTRERCDPYDWYVDGHNGYDIAAQTLANINAQHLDGTAASG